MDFPDDQQVQNYWSGQVAVVALPPIITDDPQHTPSTVESPRSGSAQAALAEAMAGTSVKGEVEHEGSIWLNLSCSCLAS